MLPRAQASRDAADVTHTCLLSNHSLEDEVSLQTLTISTWLTADHHHSALAHLPTLTILLWLTCRPSPFRSGTPADPHHSALPHCRPSPFRSVHLLACRLDAKLPGTAPAHVPAQSLDRVHCMHAASSTSRKLDGLERASICRAWRRARRRSGGMHWEMLSWHDELEQVQAFWPVSGRASTRSVDAGYCGRMLGRASTPAQHVAMHAAAARGIPAHCSQHMHVGLDTGVDCGHIRQVLVGLRDCWGGVDRC